LDIAGLDQGEVENVISGIVEHA